MAEAGSGWRQRVRDFFRVAKACRVSLASVAIGGVLMVFAPQARDLLFEQGSDAWHHQVLWLTFPLLVAVLWALPTHYSARLVLDEGHWRRPHESVSDKDAAELAQRAAWSVRWVPRLIALSCFLVVLIGIHLARLDLPSNRDLNLLTPSERQLNELAQTIVATAVFILIFLTLRGRLVAWLSRRLNIGPLMQRGFGLGLLAAASAFPIVLSLFPSYLAYFPRALFLPVALGAWIPFLSLLAIVSHRLRVPVIGAVLAVILAASFLPGSVNDLRRTESFARGQLSLSEAIRLWAKANNCELENGRPKDKRTCGPPIIVVGSGGASRAAFYTGSAIGALLDATCSTKGSACDQWPIMANRIFAISSVSGSSLAAVTVSAVLKRSGISGVPPCTNGDDIGLYFREGAPNGWQQCLQLLLSGDFLSPTAVGLVFHDSIPLLNRFGVDRAGMIEDAWTERFGQVLGLKSDDTGPSLDDPFSDFLPTEDRWLPLLVLNGTSVTSGRRILTSHLDPIYASSGSFARIFTDAHDMYEILGFGRIGLPSLRIPVHDLSLATAATNSARFPVISPAGTIRVGDTVKDRIVDGGYLENFGALTAAEIVAALKSHGFDPFVLAVTNDPEHPSNLPEPALIKSYDPPALPDPIEVESPWWMPPSLRTVLATRTARGSLALAEMRQMIKTPKGGKLSRVIQTILESAEQENFAYVKIVGETRVVDGRLKQLSMSWWLSEIVQEILDSSLRTPRNRVELKLVCDTLPVELERSGCTARLYQSLVRRDAMAAAR